MNVATKRQSISFVVASKSDQEKNTALLNQVTSGGAVEWLEYCSGDTEGYADFVGNESLAASLLMLIDEVASDPSSEKLTDICHHLYRMLRLREVGYYENVFQFLPVLITHYLHAISSSAAKNSKTLEAFLTGVYNYEMEDFHLHHQEATPRQGSVVSSTAVTVPTTISNSSSGQLSKSSSGVQPKSAVEASQFRLPSLAVGSIYHSPAKLETCIFSESALRRLETHSGISWPYPPPQERLAGTTRFRVLASLLHMYNGHLSSYHMTGLRSLCVTTQRLCVQGFPSSSLEGPRLPLTPEMALELINAVQFAMYNGCMNAASEAVEDVHERATFELWPDVLLVTRALKHSSGMVAGGHREVPGALTSVPTLSRVHSHGKALITNASFRTKKLPDDIERVAIDEEYHPVSSSGAPSTAGSIPNGGLGQESNNVGGTNASMSGSSSGVTANGGTPPTQHHASSLASTVQAGGKKLQALLSSVPSSQSLGEKKGKGNRQSQGASPSMSSTGTSDDLTVGCEMIEMDVK